MGIGAAAELIFMILPLCALRMLPITAFVTLPVPSAPVFFFSYLLLFVKSFRHFFSCVYKLICFPDYLFK